LNLMIMTDPARAAVTVSHHVDAFPEAVWHALTDGPTVARWWAPAADLTPVIGQPFTLDMGAWGVQRCAVTSVETARHIAYRFAIGVLDTEISWTLTPERDGTRVDLTHSGFDLTTPMGRQGYEGMGQGWPIVLTRLAMVIGQSVDEPLLKKAE
jgi:uncharacterized protein YndB with AHSA1/START domain